MLNRASRGILLSLYKPRIADCRRFSSFSFKDPRRSDTCVQHRLVLKEYKPPVSSSVLFDNVFATRYFSVSVTNWQEAQSSTATAEVPVLESNENVLETLPPPPVPATSSPEVLVSESNEIVLEPPQPPVAPVTSSSEVSESNEIVLDFLPDKPVPIEGLGDATIKYIGDPPFEALGLASWWPAGRFQYFMEQIHVNLDLPWWGTIVAMTVILRLITFPAVVMSQKNAAKASVVGPKMQELQMKMSDARSRGDVYDSAKYGMELQEYMTKHGYNPLKFMVPMLFQFPFFMSMFIGLRGMANLPVESMCNGGLGWFTDLSVSDPFYLLPAATATTLFLQLKLGADGINLNQVGPMFKNFMKYGAPSIVFVATMNFPAAVTFYWFTTNIISVCQAKVIRTKSIRKKLGIPKFKTPKEQLPSESKGFLEGIREGELILARLCIFFAKYDFTKFIDFRFR